MRDSDGMRLTQTEHWFRYWLPYQFAKLELGTRKHVYLPVNRNYKPLGMLTKAFVKYEDYVSQAVVFSSDPHTFKGVWHDPEGLYLYNDGPQSRRDYFERLEKLLSRSMIVGGKAKI